MTPNERVAAAEGFSPIATDLNEALMFCERPGRAITAKPGMHDKISLLLDASSARSEHYGYGGGYPYVASGYTRLSLKRRPGRDESLGDAVEEFAFRGGLTAKWKMMYRRELIRLLSLAGVTTVCGCSHFPLEIFGLRSKEGEDSGAQDFAEVNAQTAAKPEPAPEPTTAEPAHHHDVRDKSVHFEKDFPDDIYFTGAKLEMVRRLVVKFRAVQRHVGHGNFNVMGMDEFIRLAGVARGSTPITAEEKLFLEEVFEFDAKAYGFQGEKVATKFTDTIRKNEVEKIPYTGHFLRRGKPVEMYERIAKDVGSSVILTSGVRALAKQFHLFFEKGLETGGNMSKASRSLAPPGYSFHGLGDFDVGRRGFGLKNFTDDFAATDEYKRLLDLGYVQIRYTESNTLGVRFEPWHIKVHPHG